MDKALFNQLKESLREAVAIKKGTKKASRTFKVAATDVQTIRQQTGLTQKELATLMRVSIKTIQNWEQGRRQPQGPASALIQIFQVSPKEAIKALQAS